MGRDKSRLRLGGKTFLAHIRSTARLAGFNPRVLRKDLVSRCGPLGGVYTALRSTHADAVLFLSCDMPFVSPLTLHELCSRLKPRSRAVFVVQKEFGFPFVLRRTALKQVEALIEKKQFSIQTLARTLKATGLRLPPGQAVQACNVNTRQDYSIARKLWREWKQDGIRSTRTRPAGSRKDQSSR